MTLKLIKGIFLFGVLSACIGCTNKSEIKREKPNILFLFTDDQRYGTIGELHQDEVVTPNMDKLVQQGVCFENAYILGAPHGAVCSPSRAMLMTGRHYYNLPVNVYAQWAIPLSERGKCDYITFPEYFKANGYETFATGKQHNGTPWVERGFDVGKAIYMGGMTKHFGTSVKDYSPDTGWSEVYSNAEKFSSEVFADAAISYLQTKKKHKPFLMYVSFTAPHDPRTAPEAYHLMYPSDGITLPANFMSKHPFPIGDMQIRDENLAAFPRTQAEIKKHISDYYAMISATDTQIGRILEALENTGMADNTIIVFSGDNGLAVGQHGLVGKQSIYEHSVKVPLVFCGPGIPQNQRTNALAYLHDVFPTLCGLCGLDIPESVQTKDLSGVISGKKDMVREAIYFGYSAWPGDILNKKEGEDNGRGVHRGIRKGDWKLILSSKDGVLTTQLFNLKEDPFELNNVFDDQSNAAKIKTLKSNLEELMKTCKDPADLNKDMFGLYDAFDAEHLNQ